MTAPRIDAHLHLWDLDEGGYSWLGPQHGHIFRSFTAIEAEALMGQYGIDSAILVQAEDSQQDTDAMLRTARTETWVRGVVAWVPLDDDLAAEAEIERLSSEPVVCGLRHLVHDDPREGFLELPAVRRSLRRAAAAGLAFDVPDAWPRHLQQTVDLARAVPELTVVLDHLGKPPLEAGKENFRPWRDSMRALAALPNTAAKVSGLRLPGVPYTKEAIRPAWEEALNTFGPQRLMLGSDWPVSLMGGPYSESLQVLDDLVDELSPNEQQWLRSRSAESAYKL
ncbi:L-fuconolactonase [Pseudarthrobacter equi]|uniref:L-fuconolactonase n=1 Tax=Pseudarthrobacter equi TaxID=728066 RepID=A0A1H1THS8_9MICC|nr:amidohydrolase family protein [Pseudarthrobacter equi]SDS59750.1 L-fuconolactonase [Pseudarthrobacter equi]